MKLWTANLARPAPWLEAGGGVTATGATPNTHWCARGHGADLIAYAHSAGPRLA